MSNITIKIITTTKIKTFFIVKTTAKSNPKTLKINWLTKMLKMLKNATKKFLVLCVKIFFLIFLILPRTTRK